MLANSASGISERGPAKFLGCSKRRYERPSPRSVWGEEELGERISKRMTTISCCAECGKEGDVNLKACKSCMFVKYCNAECQRNHWPTHKKQCKLRAAELRDEALFKDPPPKKDCPICFLPMPVNMFACASLPDATITSVPINDFANAHVELAKNTEIYYPCCGQTICGGCRHSFHSRTGSAPIAILTEVAKLMKSCCTYY